MIKHSEFQPYLFIDIGETAAYYTLREAYLHAIPGEGPYGNSVINGVYQGTWEIRSQHIKNLSQDSVEAYQKAQEASKKMGLPLKGQTPSIKQRLREIERASEAHRQAEEEREEKRVNERREREESLKRIIDTGVFPFGKWKDCKFDDADRGYIDWLIGSEDAEEGSAMEYLVKTLKEKFAPLPTPDKDLYVGTPKKRQEFNVTVIRKASFESFYGYTTITTMVDNDTGACLVSKGAFSPRVGETFDIKATVKSHEDYQGQAQTVVQRVAAINN